MRFGSIITARKTRIFPTTATAERTEQNVAEVMLKLVGAEIFEQGYDPNSDMSVCEDLRSVTSSVHFVSLTLINLGGQRR